MRELPDLSAELVSVYHLLNEGIYWQEIVWIERKFVEKMNDYNTKQQQKQETQQMEWKWSWQDEFLKWVVLDMLIQMAAFCILE